MMLNFTNLGFILAIIIIAFATILRLESYAIKQTLWKLIVAALLVNFSLVICGGIISVSKLTTDSFYNHITAGGKTMGNVLGTLAQPQEVTAPIAKNVLEKHMTQQRVFKLIYRNWSIKFCSWISISISDEFYHNINLFNTYCNAFS